MSAADFRHIAFGRGARNCERVFRAAISAYCTLDRPTRQEVAQIDDLALGLFDAVSTDARRFAAAALSVCDPAPPGLVRRLAEEPLETAAPLLMRSRVLTDVDLIALIGRHGIPHARAIAEREDLNPIIAALIRALVARAETEKELPPAPEEPQTAPSEALEEVRNRLRDLMRDGETVPGKEPPSPADDPYPKLREAALSGDVRLFAFALGGVLGLPQKRTEMLAADPGHPDLLVALRALDLDPERALLLATNLFPARFAHTAGVRLFLTRYAAISADAARLRVDFWRRDDGRNPATLHSLANAR